MSKLKPGKVAIIGCGFVGSASAFALMQSGLFTEMVLLDANHQKAGRLRKILAATEFFQHTGSFVFSFKFFECAFNVFALFDRHDNHFAKMVLNFLVIKIRKSV